MRRRGAVSRPLLWLLACSVAVLVLSLLFALHSTRFALSRLRGDETMQEISRILGHLEEGTGRKGTIMLKYGYWDGGGIVAFGDDWGRPPLYIDVTYAGGAHERWRIRDE
jgi:hypothetical protein